jgi:hypothetical protein
MDSSTFELRMRLPPGMSQDDAIELLGAADCTETLVGVGEPRVLSLLYLEPVSLSMVAKVARVLPEAVVLGFRCGAEVPM